MTDSTKTVRREAAWEPAKGSEVQVRIGGWWTTGTMSRQVAPSLFEVVFDVNGTIVSSDFTLDQIEPVNGRPVNREWKDGTMTN